MDPTEFPDYVAALGALMRADLSPLLRLLAGPADPAAYASMPQCV